MWQVKLQTVERDDVFFTPKKIEMKKFQVAFRKKKVFRVSILKFTP